MTELPALRLARVAQQLRSFAELHATELETLAAELEAAAQTELASKVRAFSAIQRDETVLVLEEVEDIQRGLTPPEEEQDEQPPSATWQDSPKRAQWLAKQTAPRSRRDLLRGGRTADQ